MQHRNRLLIRVISQRTDKYAIGVMLYELITGIDLFAGNTRDETCYNHIRKVFDYDANLPGELFAIIKKATEKNPDLRYASAMELNADIVWLYLEGSVPIWLRLSSQHSA